MIVSPDRDISGALPDGIEFVPQEVANGTGGAVRAARASRRGLRDRARPLRRRAARLRRDDRGAARARTPRLGAAATLVTADPRRPRLLRPRRPRPRRRGRARSSRPRPTATRRRGSSRSARSTPASTSSTGPRSPRRSTRIGNDNAQGEYYLPDVLGPIREAGGAVLPFVSDDPNVILGVNSRVDLARRRGRGATPDPRAPHARRRHRRRPGLDLDRGRRRDRLRRAARARLHADRREPDRHRLGRRPAHDDDRRRARRRLQRPALLPGRVLGRRPLLGRPLRLPAAEGAARGGRQGRHLRRDQELGRSAPGTKVPHLSYIGDADVGEGTNLGAATITANYDGLDKNRTKIGRNVRTAVDTTLVAPVEVGDDAYTGAGSVIGEDVPPGALGIARPRAAQHRGLRGAQGGRAAGQQGAGADR